MAADSERQWRWVEQPDGRIVVQCRDVAGGSRRMPSGTVIPMSVATGWRDARAGDLTAAMRAHFVAQPEAV